MADGSRMRRTTPIASRCTFKRFLIRAPKIQISTDGGTEPIWAKSGLELFYRNGDKMMSVAIDAKGDSIEPRTPVLLFEGRFAMSNVTGGDDAGADHAEPSQPSHVGRRRQIGDHPRGQPRLRFAFARLGGQHGASERGSVRTR